MTLEALPFLLSPLIIAGLGVLAKQRIVRWFLLILAALSLFGLLFHTLTSGDGDPWNSPTLWIPFAYVTVVPVCVVVALLFELIHRMGWRG